MKIDKHSNYVQIRHLAFQLGNSGKLWIFCQILEKWRILHLEKLREIVSIWMEQNLLIDSDLNVGNNPDGEYDEIKIGDDDINDNDEFWTVDADIEDDDDSYTRHDYIAHFGRKA
ncbi:hypothetical protein RCL_jg20387.t1 [Rhizophagus clarus]|uniref:Uncharacterized protein n=1 Tax=Rhizophagus clarus TaxID=94130 RepID=A0A8H3KYK1_9GLOM|nr:hypothetical protein RCL_jg20387.t1 [Rhizophagus clarus]